MMAHKIIPRTSETQTKIVSDGDARVSPSWKQIIITVLLITAPLFSLAGVSACILLPMVINHQVSSKFVISGDINPELYAAWISPPVPVYLKVYVFNVTNPDEVKSGSYPQLSQVGPYVFQENRTKIDIVHDQVSDTVTYTDNISYVFVPELSGNLRLNDVVTIINVPFVAAAMKSSDGFLSFTQSYIQSAKETVFVQKTVGEVTFAGWTVPLLEKLETELGLNFFPDNKFAFFQGQNESSHGPYTVSRGIRDKSTFGTVLKYQNETSLSAWGDRDSFCNAIYGTDGTLVPPHVKKSTIVRLFNAELCRSIYLTFADEVRFNGIKGFKFTAPLSTIGDPRLTEENSCFCPGSEDECGKQGALYMGPCKDGHPVAVSNPHFLYAVPEYVQKSGLNPDKTEHETYLVIEPLTGLILKASKKIQVNLILKPVEDYSSMRNLPEMLFPLFWAEECAELDEVLIGKLKSALFNLRLVSFSVKVLLAGIAAVLSMEGVRRRLRSISRANLTRENRKAVHGDTVCGKLGKMGQDEEKPQN